MRIDATAISLQNSAQHPFKSSLVATSHQSHFFSIDNCFSFFEFLINFHSMWFLFAWQVLDKNVSHFIGVYQKNILLFVCFVDPIQLFTNIFVSRNNHVRYRKEKTQHRQVRTTTKIYILFSFPEIIIMYFHGVKSEEIQSILDHAINISTYIHMVSLRTQSVQLATNIAYDMRLTFLITSNMWPHTPTHTHAIHHEPDLCCCCLLFHFP